MTSNLRTPTVERGGAREVARGRDLMRTVVPVARALYVAIFLTALPHHFSHAAIAMGAAHGVPLASVAVPAAGVLAFVGGLSVLLGYHARVGAWLLVLFLVPVTLAMHDFWHVADPTMKQVQTIMFLKNVSMLGAALLITWFGAGPVSLDARRS
jgi:putative oxidoreductase